MASVSKSGHGGNVYAAARLLRRPIERLTDFSASINPLGPSPRAIRAIAQANPLLRHYPDPDCTMLREALAIHWCCSPDQIVIGNGSAELIHLLPGALRLRRLIVIGPTFSEYASAMQRCGGSVITVMAKRADGYRPPLDRVMELLSNKKKSRSGFDAVLLCNPNSPTGQACEPSEVMELAQAVTRWGGLFVVDETFMDYCDQRSILSLSGRHNGIVVLRSFTKFFALPGLRVGYLVASSEVVRAIRAVQPPWSVNVLAQEAARASLADRRHAERSRAFMTRERMRFATQLKKLEGCQVFRACANFLLMELPSRMHAGTVTKRLRRKGLLIRDCSEVPGLNSLTIRVAVRTRRENDRLVQALSALIG